MIAHSNFASSPDDLDVHHQFLTPIIFEAALILVISDRIDPAIGKLAHEQISELQLDSLLEGILPAVQETWGTKSIAEIVAATNGQLTGMPFSDVVTVTDAGRAQEAALGMPAPQQAREQSR